MDCFKKLRLNTQLRVLNLKDNAIHDLCAHEILKHYADVNVYLEQIILTGNKCLNTTEVEHINDECRKNQLI